MSLCSVIANRGYWQLHIVALLTLLSYCSSWAQESSTAPAAQEQSLEQLINQLADRSFNKRQQAQETLLKLGPSIQAALQKGLLHQDAEVRRSCRRLLADVLETKYQQDLETFIKEPQSTAGNELPGWKRFQQRTGEAPAGRQLFVQMQQAERGLLASLDAGNEAAAEALDTRFRQVYSRTYSRVAGQRKPPTLGTLAALLFVCGDPQLQLPTSITDNSYWVNLLQQSALQQALTKGSSSSPLRLLLGDWIAKPTSSRSLYNKLRLSLQYEIPAGLELSLTTLKDTKNLSGSYQAYCVHVIAMLGGKNYSHSLNELLKNQTVCSRRILRKNNKQVQLTVEIRDVALAWLLFLHGQDHKEYGMLQAKATLDRTRLATRTPSLSVSTTSLGFNTPQQRPVALKKWQAYVAANPLLPLPEKLTVVSRPKSKVPPNRSNKKPNLDDAIERLRKAIPGKAPAKPPAKAPAKAVPPADAVQKVQVAPPAAAKKAPLPAKKGFAAPVPRVLVPPPARAMLPPMIFPGQRPKPGQAQKQLTVPGMPVADRDMTRRLTLAQRAINEQRYVEAVILLGGILTAKLDHTYQPDRNIPLSRGLKGAAEQLVGSMPAAGREVYELHFDAQARRLLDEAVQQADTATLTDISHQFFHTPSGAEATYLLGTHYLKQSHPLRGAMYFRRLQQKSHHRRHYEPMLNIQLATCWALAGLPTRAEEALVQLKREYPDVQLSVAGKRQSLFRQPAQALNWLADQIGPFSLAVASNSWPLFRGNSQRNQMSSGKVPYLDSPQWKISQSIEYLDKQISEIRSNTLEKRFPLLPSMQPLVVNETILFRTPTELVAVARKTGEMLWKAPFDDALRHLVRHNKQPLDEAQQQSLTRGLQRRLWNNPTFGTMSSDSHQVYSVEGLGFGDVQIQQRLVIMTDGTQRLDPGYLKSYNTLVAYDLESGKAVWEVGGAQNRLANPLAGYFFLGPPLPFGGRLYVIGLENQQTRLLELDAKNGAVVWQITLADSNLTEDLQSKMRQTPFVLPQNRQFKSGATPSSSEGILVCPISDSSFVAVNLTTRSLLWMYDAANQETYANQRMINPWQAPFGGTIPVEEPQTWTDTSVTISGDRVILTPQFSEKILCLDLSTGALQWSLPRGDGLYIAGIAADHVIIVGRSHLSAVRLADGSNIWPERYIEFPAGAIPSGRGYLSPGKFHLPLTTAEVAVFDLQKGRLEARSHSPTGIIPGNLVNCDDFVISQSATGIYRFTSISSQHQILTDQLKDQSGDARLLAQSGEILLYAGRVLEAVENLRKSQDLKPDANTSRLLAAAIVEGLRIDDQTFLEIAQELGPELAKGQQDASFLRQLIRIYQRSDEHLKAFDSCLRLIKTSSNLQILEDIAGTRRVRRDRWLAARIKEIWQAADQPTQQAILEKLQPLLAEIKLSHALSLFGELPIIADLQLKAAQAALQQRDLVIAENLLQRVWKTGKPPQQRLAAAQLARLYQQAGRHGVAAKIYRLIAKEYRDEPVIDGKTGAQLVAALTDEDLVKRWLDGDLNWPKKTPQQTETKKSHSTRYRLPVTIRQTAAQLNSAINIDVDSQGRTLTALNGNGKQLWQIKLVTPKVSMPFMGPAYNHIQGQLDGNLFFTWLGNRVCAIDGLSPSGKLLWDNPTWSNSHVMAARMPRPIFRGQRLAWQQNKLKAAEAIPIVVCSTCVCYQKDNQLLAVDRFTGKILWSRDGLSAKSDLFGDDQYLFVTSPDSSHAAVFNILDGDQLGTRELPKQKDRMITLGRQILTWTSNPQAASWTLYDPWSQKLVWKRSFSPVTKPTLVNPQTVATLEPQGQFVVQRVADGKVLLEGSIPKPKAFNDIAVLEDSSQFFLAVNKEDAQANFIPTSSNNGRLVVNGNLHAFDRSSKKLNWTAEIGPQLLTLDQSRNFPVLVFSVQTRKQTGPGKYTSAAEVHCLDKRTGKTIYKKSNTYSNQLVSVEAKPTQQLVELRFRSTLVQLKYGDQPVATSKEKEPGPNNPPQGKGDKQPTKPPTAAEETPADRLKNLFRRLGTPSPPTAPAPAKPDPFR